MTKAIPFKNDNSDTAEPAVFLHQEIVLGIIVGNGLGFKNRIQFGFRIDIDLFVLAPFSVKFVILIPSCLLDMNGCRQGFGRVYDSLFQRYRQRSMSRMVTNTLQITKETVANQATYLRRKSYKYGSSA